MNNNLPTFTFSPEHQDECLVMVPGTYRWHISPKPPEHEWDYTLTQRLLAVSPPAVGEWLLRLNEISEDEDLKEGDLIPWAGHFSYPDENTMIHTMEVGAKARHA